MPKFIIKRQSVATIEEHFAVEADTLDKAIEETLNVDPYFTDELPHDTGYTYPETREVKTWEEFTCRHCGELIQPDKQEMWIHTMHGTPTCNLGYYMRASP